MMRVVQVANFYGPRSGGLRTAVDRLGAEYCARGHEVFPDRAGGGWPPNPAAVGSHANIIGGDQDSIDRRLSRDAAGTRHDGAGIP